VSVRFRRGFSIRESPSFGSGVYPSEWLLAHWAEVGPAKTIRLEAVERLRALMSSIRERMAFNDDVSMVDVFENKPLSQALCFV